MKQQWIVNLVVQVHFVVPKELLPPLDHLANIVVLLGLHLMLLGQMQLTRKALRFNLLPLKL